MAYEQALDKAWKDVAAATSDKRLTVKFLSDIYDIDIERRIALSSSCNVPAKDYATIIMLHYLLQKLALTQLPAPSREWVDFTSLVGGEGYYPTFKKRTIDRVLGRYGKNPEALLGITDRMPSKILSLGDVAVVIYPFVEVGILIKMSKGDEEFGPSADILFDGNISRIFCTEDIVVLTEIVVHQL